MHDNAINNMIVIGGGKVKASCKSMINAKNSRELILSQQEKDPEVEKDEEGED